MCVRTRFRKMHEARDQLMRFMQAAVRDRRVEVQGQEAINDGDILTMLIKANESESGKYRLDDQELVSTRSNFPIFF